MAASMTRGTGLLPALLLLAACCTCSAATGRRVLALLQAGGPGPYSLFFDALAASGFNVTCRSVKEPSSLREEGGAWQYDHLILFAPRAQSFGGSTLEEVLEFIDAGRNVLLAVNSEVSPNLISLASEVGIDLDDRGTRLYDHFSHAIVNGRPDHNLVVVSDVIKSTVILGKETQAPLLYRGIAALVPAGAELVSIASPCLALGLPVHEPVPVGSELVTVAATAPLTAYAHVPGKPMSEPPLLLAGSSASLVSLVQARNNARVLVSGSLDLFSNELFEAEVRTADGTSFPRSGNRDFALAAARWTFQDRGQLRAERLRHRVVGGDLQPSAYRVGDEVEVMVDIYEVEAGERAAYRGEDVQVELVMLDPWVRLPLQHDGLGTFSLRFRVPDVPGVFKYVIDYKRQGFSYISMSLQVPVRPLHQSEYERFLPSAYPYYASACSSMAAFFILAFLLLYHK